jgi:hypothetical protein
MGKQPMIHVCIKCTDRAKGCTHISEDGNRLPLICVNEKTRQVITCVWREVPKKEELGSIIIAS